MATESAPDSPPYRILIRVSELCLGIEKKLQKYFQNTSKSGGGKCKVRVGPTDSTFWVEFNRKQAKDGVLAKKNHSVAVSDKLRVNIFLETNEEPEENKSNVLEISQFSSQTLALPTPFLDDKTPDDVRALIPSNFFLQKIFLHVEAQLTFKLSRDQKEIIFTLCPEIKIEGGQDGPERLIGDFEDIEKIYRYLTDTMLGNDRKDDYSYSASASEVEEVMPNDNNSLVLYSDPKMRGDEDLDLLSVPAHLYEYFKYFFAETLDRIEVEHEVRIKSALVYPTGNVSLDFETNKEWDKEAAREAFTRTFQREIENMSDHRDVGYSENKLVLDMQKTLSDMFQNLHIKAEERDLVLWGTQKEVLEAQRFIEKNYPLKKPSAEGENPNTGIEVDTAHWRVLGQEIREIEKTYYTAMELVHKTKTQKTLIVFRPKDKDVDLSAHAYEDFIDIFQMLLPQVVTDVVSLKPIDQRRKSWLETTFYENLEKKHPHVILQGNIQEISITGLPKYVEKAMKYIKKYFSVEIVEHKEGAFSVGGN